MANFPRHSNDSILIKELGLFSNPDSMRKLKTWYTGSKAAGSGQERANEMATEKTDEWQDATAGADANSVDDGWTAVEDEVQIKLENEGEGFIGTYVSRDKAGTIDQLHFTNVTDLDGNFIAARAFVNGSRDLVNKINTVPFRRLVRAQWTTSMNTGQITPMRVFSVQWK
jgi:hypothetical protein